MGGVFVFGSDLRFTHADAVAQRQVGYDMDALVMMSPWDIKPALDQRQFMQLLEPLIDGTQQHLGFCTIHQHRDGRRLPVEIDLRMLPGNDPKFVVMAREQLNVEAMVRREQIRHMNRQPVRQSLRSFVKSIGRDIEADIELLRQGEQARVMGHLAQYAGEIRSL